MIKNILLGADFSPKSKVAFQYALELQNKYGAVLSVLNVNEDFLSKDEMIMSRVSIEDIKKNNEEMALSAKKQFEQVLSELKINNLDRLQMFQREGVASEEIIEYSEKNNIDLIVIGSNGRSAIEELFLGSTAKKVINKSRVPVLVVPLSD